MAEQKMNCWEYMECGCEPGGFNAERLGVCPAAIDKDFDGTNTGKNGGRYCWAITGTLCDGKPQGSFAGKFEDCHECSFFKIIEQQQGSHFVLLRAHPLY